MAEQHTGNARTPETAEHDTLAAAEQPQSQPQSPVRPARRGKTGAENGGAKRTSTRKRTTGEIDALAHLDTNNGANGANGANSADNTNGLKNVAAPKKTRTRKKTPDAPASPAESTAADQAPAPPRKRKPAQKSLSSRRRKTAQPEKQEEVGPQESVATETVTPAPDTSTPVDTKAVTLDAAPFEPDLDPTPVKARETRPLASLEAELDALLSELVLEEPLSELEDTMARPAQRIAPPETPMPPALELPEAPDTPLPPVDEEDVQAELPAPATGEEEVWDTVVIEEEAAAPAIAVVDMPVVEPAQTTPPAAVTSTPIVVPPAVVTRPEVRPRPRPLKRVAMLVALVLCLASSLLLWQNASQTHLYLYTIEPGNGQKLARQDLGGYASISALSNPAQDSSSLFVSVSSAPSAQQQVLALTNSDTSWSVTRQFAAAPGRSTLSVGPGHVLAIEDSSGLQVLTGDGRVLWQVAGDAPLLGAHPFTPAFDGSTVYTITSARRGMVGAYDMRTGTPRWTVQIDDTLNYAPSALLAGDTLYVAGDHTLYALNTITGGTHWKVAMPARTLLYSQGNSPALIAAGASGLAAYDPQNGNLLWAFNGQPDMNNADGETDRLTPAQFYQASLSSDSTTIYATGVVWDTRQLQQQLWLFAVDASSGKVAWSVPIGTGFTNADAGRVFAPFIDATHKLIVIEQAQSDGSHTLSAFDTGDGFQRWSVRLAAVSASSPALVRTGSGNLSVFSAQRDAGLALRTGSGPRQLLLVLAITSFLALLLLWIIPLRGRLSNANRRLSRLPHALLAPLRVLRRLWRFSRLLFAITIAAVVIGASLPTYTQLNSQQPYVRQVGGNGNAMWQHTASSATTLAGTDSSGVLLVTGAADHTFALAALDSNGSTLWTLPSGEGTFTLPAVTTQTGTVLAALHGPVTLPYSYAANDPAYPNPLAHYFALYLLNSQTGAVLWRTASSATNALEDADVLGTDAQFIYLAGRSFGQNAVAQLMAVDKTNGTLAWRFYGPREQAGSAANLGAILARGNLLYWQVDSAVYALNPQTGQVEWRDAIPEVDAQVAPLEDAQMATGSGVLLVRRSDMYHALDLMTGVERWTLSGLGVDNTQIPGGVLADGSKFILYGGGTIEAFDPANHSVLWKHLDLVAVSNVSLSPDGLTIYAVVFNNVDGGTNTQALVALDANSDLIRWTFQPGAQAQFVYAGTRIIYNANGMIYLATCFANGPGTCTHQTLYGVDEQTGKARWQIDARRIYALQTSPNGQTLTFQTESSAWENLKALFRG